MDEKTITALAREYAEFTDLSPVDKKNVSAICECFLKFISRRFCLVEKSKAVAEYKNVAKAVKAKREYNLTLSEDKLAKADLLFDLFPEIAKEVEG